MIAPALCCLLACLAPPESLLANGGFELPPVDGRPADWGLANGHLPAAVADDQPRTGLHVGRLAGDGEAHAWRQVVAEPGTRALLAVGWFRGHAIQLDKSAQNEHYLRFYCHILYRDRPYAETTHQWQDLPAGDYGWTRFAVPLTPRSEQPVECVWITVAGRFAAGTLDFDDLELRPAATTPGVRAIGWANAAQAVVLRDLGTVQPAAALARRARHGKWKLIDYEAGGQAGRLLWASGETAAPPITLALGVKGWHAVYLGLADPASLGCAVRAKLTGDPASLCRPLNSGAIEEVYLKSADLTGRSLILSQVHWLEPRGAGIAYVKLVPLTAGEAAACRASDPAQRSLVASLDGFSFVYDRRPTTREELLEEIEPYRGSDFGTLLLQPGGADMVNYPSAVGDMRGQDLDDFSRSGDRRYAESLRELARQKINPTRVLIEGAHGVGMQVHVCVRPGAWQYSEPLSEFFGSRFYDAHPEWRCRDRTGNLVPRMSLAVPQVRAHLVDVLREAVRFGADGAGVLFVRGVPVVLFEPPFAELFRQRHGAGLAAVTDDDPRLTALRCEVVTGFLREIRRMLDEEAVRRKDAKRLVLSVMVLADEADNLRYGLDVRGWAAAGLVDLVAPYLHAGGGRAQAYDMAFFRDVCAAKRIPVKPTLVTWDAGEWGAALRRIDQLYRDGADGITFWDANAAATRPERWAVLGRLGHREELPELLDWGILPPLTQSFHRLGGLVMDGPYGPDWGY